MATIAEPGLSLARQGKDDAREFRLIFAVSFPVFLVAALVARLLPWHGRGAPAARRPSIIEEARIAANTSIPFAFMG